MVVWNPRSVPELLASLAEKVERLAEHSPAHLLKHMEHKIMSAIDDLNANLQQLTTNVQTLTDNIATNDKAIQAEIEKLALALAANDPTAVTAAAQKIADLSASIASAAAAVSAETAKLTA